MTKLYNLLILVSFFAIAGSSNAQERLASDVTSRNTVSGFNQIHVSKEEEPDWGELYVEGC